MKKIFLLILFSVCVISAKSQFFNIHNFYTHNLFFYSPAHTGDKEKLAAFLVYRDHLSYLSDAVQNGVFGIHSPVTKKMNAGALIKTQRIGLFETLSARLDYSFRTSVSENQVLGLGINGGLLQRNLNAEDAFVFDENDPALAPNYINKYQWFFGASLNYQFKNLNFDIGVPVLYKEDKDVFSNYFVFLSYDIFTKSNRWMFKPSAAGRYLYGKQFNYHLNFMVNYDNVFWFQPSYKANNSIAVSVGVNLGKFGIAYAYETNSAALSSIGGPSHEIMLSYGLFKGRYRGDTLVTDQNKLIRKIGDQSYEDYVSSNNFGFYNNILSLTDSLHKEEVRKIDSIQSVLRRDSMEQVRKDSLRAHTLRHLNNDELKLLEIGVLFELGSAMLNQKSRNYLDDVAELIQKNPNIRILISGHTCDIGTEEVNLRFSKDRAEAVAYYLKSKGVNQNQLSTDMKLDAEPIVPNTNEENRQKNRRVSFSIIRE